MVGQLVAASMVGNLGNQLFQFAAVKGLQQDPDAPAIIDERLSMEWRTSLQTVLREGSFRSATRRELLRLRQAPLVPRGQRTLMRMRDALDARVPASEVDGT